MKKALEDAYLGKPPQTYGHLPAFVTAELALAVINKIRQGMKEVAVRKLELLRAEGIRPSPYDARFMRATKEMEAESEEIKLAVYNEFGLTRCEDTPTVTLHNAIVKFSHEDPRFPGKLQAIEKEYQDCMQQIMQDRRSR
mmetsp:Transcript_7538/g.14013  ORF Transcript_7538/g.14013 Transcript_7538/m.14013 type:complete len:140 (+) Transcript_7538:483-902(+)